MRVPVSDLPSVAEKFDGRFHLICHVGSGSEKTLFGCHTGNMAWTSVQEVIAYVQAHCSVDVVDIVPLAR